jgi:hypothetical protein
LRVVLNLGDVVHSLALGGSRFKVLLLFDSAC